MSFQEFWGVDAFIGDECEEYTSDFVTKVLRVVNSWPIVWYFVMVTMTIFYVDVFFLMVSVLTWYDMGVNFLLNFIIQQPSPIEGCVWFWEMPSYQSELLVMLGTVFTMMGIGRDYRIGWHALNTLLLFGYSIVFYRAYAHINTPAQLLVGALVGFGNGCLGYLVFWFYVVPSMPVLRNVCEWCGLENRFHKERYDEFVLEGTVHPSPSTLPPLG